MRTTYLKCATTGVVITVVVAVVLMGVLRSGMIQPAGADEQKGAAIFVEKGCVHCHYAERSETKIGPGLKGLFTRDELPVSGKEAIKDNVLSQLHNPYRNMPSFADRLTEEEEDRLISYLKKL